MARSGNGEHLLHWGGDERGNNWSGRIQDFPFCIPVGSQVPQAVGVAYAFKLRKEARVAVRTLAMVRRQRAMSGRP